jgi:hypothetical protein
MAIRFTILGQPVSMKNSRQIVQIGGRPVPIKSADARDWERTTLLQIPPEYRKSLEGPMRITVHAYYESERPDLDLALLMDCLQNRYKKVKGALLKVSDGVYKHEDSERKLVQRGVVANDRQFREQHFFHHIDKANPRAEIEIEPIVGPLFE